MCKRLKEKKMKSQRTDQRRAVRWLSTVLLFGAVLILMLPAGAWAVGTASGTSISNQATINYDVGSVAQPAISSDGDAGTAGAQPTVFVVDNLVDLAVTTLDAAIVDVAPGASEQVIRFQLDNEGNTTQDFLLSAVAQATGGPYATPFGNLMDAFDADTGTNPVRMYMDTAAGQGATATYTPGTWDGVGAETLVTYIDELDADNSVTLYIVIDIPATQPDGDMAIYGLRAQVAVGNGPGSQGAAIGSDHSGDTDLPGTVQIVFGDGVGADDPDQVDPDGYHSSRSVYRIASATLAAAKTSTVVWDPINIAANPKAIPGARVEYTITVDNTGGTAASNVVITDPITLIPNVTFFSGSASATNNEGTAITTIEYSADGTSWFAAETTPVNYVRVTHSTIRATNGQGTLVFQVTID
jgi:uncharacterized repeat protein (TIGR01451 family)